MPEISEWHEGQQVWILHADNAWWLYTNKHDALHHMKPQYQLYSFTVTNLTMATGVPTLHNPPPDEVSPSRLTI